MAYFTPEIEKQLVEAAAHYLERTSKEIEITSSELDDQFLRLQEVFNCRVVISESPYSANTPKGNAYINNLCIRILPVRNSFGGLFRVNKITPKFILKKRFNNIKEIETEVSNIKNRIESMFPVTVTFTFDAIVGYFDIKINSKDIIVGVKYDEQSAFQYDRPNGLHYRDRFYNCFVV